MNLLEIKNLNILASDKTKLLSGVNLVVKKNSIHAILGPNGSGKTTLAQALLGLNTNKIIKGKIKFLGQDISRLPTFKRARMGLTLAWQEPARFEGIKVCDYLGLGMKSYDKEEINRALNLVGLEPKIYCERLVDEKLSGGERKRIELAAVLLMKPRLMILDEPDAGLDIIVYNEFYELLATVKKETGAGIMLITHREEAGLIADSATLLWRGKMIISSDFRQTMRRYCEMSGRQKTCKLKTCLK
ncbi:MAG: ATP-binding cassette domain-containing protein [bacterium]